MKTGKRVREMSDIEKDTQRQRERERATDSERYRNIYINSQAKQRKSNISLLPLIATEVHSMKHNVPYQ